LCARAEGDVIEIEVTDSGCGISAEFLPHVFDEFVHDPANPRAGLALVRTIVMQMNGTVSAASAGVGTGSRFGVRFPAIEPTHQMPAPSGVARRILIVDDNVDASELLAEMLRAIGHEVVPRRSRRCARSLQRSRCSTSGSPAWMATSSRSCCETSSDPSRRG